MAKVDWSMLPYDIVLHHILPKLPLDTRVSLKVKPNRISKTIRDNLEKQLNEIKHPASIYFENIQNGILKFIDIRKTVKNTIHSHHYFFVGEFDEFMCINKGDVWITLFRENNEWVKKG